jgi:AAA15 family ATPase/GTPase
LQDIEGAETFPRLQCLAALAFLNGDDADYPRSSSQKPTTHYHRKYNLETKEYEWSKLSSALKDKRTMLSEIQEVLPEKSLYLNRISQFEIPIMKNVFNFFKIKILTFNKYELDSIDTNLNQMLLQKIMDNTYFKSVIMNGLKKADFMIEDIEVIERINGSDKSFELITYHKSINEDGSNVKEKFDFNVNESTGTQKFLLALAFVWSLIQIGGYLIFDELDNSLHTHLLQYLISMVHDPKINKKNGQLIFTTHDTNLLNQDLLRRDQIWFAERDELGNSKLIPLSDYKVKKGINLENSYLQGVYGGIPNLEK